MVIQILKSLTAGICIKNLTSNAFRGCVILHGSEGTFLQEDTACKDAAYLVQ